MYTKKKKMKNTYYFNIPNLSFEHQGYRHPHLCHNQNERYHSHLAYGQYRIGICLCQLNIGLAYLGNILDSIYMLSLHGNRLLIIYSRENC